MYRTIFVLTSIALMSIPAFAGSGGPDSGGYYWYDQDESPSFFGANWVDISGSGTPVTGFTDQDDWDLAGTISWDFKFYGDNHASIYIAEDGGVYFADEYFEGFRNDAGQQHIPGNQPNTTVQTFLAPFWSEFNIYTAAGGGEIFFEDFGDHFVIMVKDLDHWDDYFATFEIIGWASAGGENSDIAFLYNFAPTSGMNDYCIGIQGNTTAGTELVHMPDPITVEVGDWYLLTTSSDPFVGIESASIGEIKAAFK